MTPKGIEAQESLSRGSSRGGLRSAIQGRISLLPTSIVILLCAGLLGWIQFSFEGMLDGDSYFHTRAARELHQHGIERSFPQTVYSTWSRRYSDKDWLFHAYLIPFQKMSLDGPSGRVEEPGAEDLVTPGKRAMIVLYVLYFSAMAFALRAVGARFPWVWILLYFNATTFIVWRLLAVRPGFAGVTLLLLEIALIVRCSGLPLAAVGALHAYTHSSFVLLPVMAVAAVIARALRREPLSLTTLFCALGGPAAAFILHPYFPHNLSIAWDQLAEVARHTWMSSAAIPRELFGQELGGVFSPSFLKWSPAYLPAVLGVVAFLASRTKRISTDGLALTLMACALLVAGWLSYRFMDFFLPVSVLLGARLWSELTAGLSLRKLAVRYGPSFWTATALLGLLLVVGIAKHPVPIVRAEMSGQVTEGQRVRSAVTFLRKVADPRDIVYHNFWYDFAWLYYYRPNGRYIDALDPIFFYRFNPRLFAAAIRIARGSEVDVHRILRDDFQARWIFLSRYPKFPLFTETISTNPRFKKVFQDDHALVFRVE